jgi:hypothetical protein
MHSKDADKTSEENLLAGYRSNEEETLRTVRDPAWNKRFDDYLDERPGGQEEWSRLMFGSNVVLLTVLAANITSGVPGILEERRETLREFGQDLRRRVPKMLSTVEAITAINNKLVDYGTDLSQSEKLSEHLQSYSREISELAKIFAPLSSKRLPKTADFILFFLHAYVDCATGQPQWRALATLLEAAYAGHGHCEEVDEECLRKKIGAMNVNRTRECSRLRQKAQEYLDS